MRIHTLRQRALALATGLALLVASGWAGADPPARVARLGYTAGPVSFSPAGEDDWVQASVNRPLAHGDRLWTDSGARAEIQVGGAMIRMDANSSVAVLNVDDRIAQLQLTQGVLNVRVRRLAPNQVFEVDTPNLALTLRQAGDYRIVVDPDGNATDVIVRKGRAEVYGEGAAYSIDARQPYRFFGTGLREYQYVDPPELDAFNRWASDRDRSYDNSPSARYVSRDVVGYQDLDANGTWREDPNYGNVWIPNRVAAGWAPYRDGHWTWIDPWGWTWVDDAPWGYAVSHYGRWTNLAGTWGWVPGPVSAPAWYAPALVAFVGGSNFRISISSGSVGAVAWFPLAPREVYQPSYQVSRGYFENVNRGHAVVNRTVVNNTVVNNTYTTSNASNVVYVNRQVPGAVIAVPATAFVQSQPVAKAALRVTREVAAGAPVAVVAAVAPTARSLHGAAAVGDRPPARVFERPVVARTAPPVAHVGFAAQQQQLSANPGKPLDDAARKDLKPAAAAPAPVVKVLAAAPAAPATALPAPAVQTAPSARQAGSVPRGAGRSQATAPAQAAPQQAVPPSAQPTRVPPRQIDSPPVPVQATRPPVDMPPTAKPQTVPAIQQVKPGPPVTASRPRPLPRVAEPTAAAPQVPASAPTVRAALRRVAPPAPSARPLQRPGPSAKPESAASARPGEPLPPVAAPRQLPQPPEAMRQPQPRPRAQRPKPVANAPSDRKNESDEPRRDEEKRK